jgi:hypothetical protein
MNMMDFIIGYIAGIFTPVVYYYIYEQFRKQKKKNELYEEYRDIGKEGTW